jgi:signal transduction histidine kinase
VSSSHPASHPASRDDSEARRDRLLAIGEIAAEVAHELRNALQIVSANVYLARQCAGVGTAEPHLAKIERSTRIAQGIVDDLMALARGEALLAEPLPVADVLPLGREWLVPSPSHGPTFEDSIEPPNLKMRAHVGLVARLFHVLYENAIKAKATRITTTARAVGERVQIEIADDGPGVSEQIRETLFEPLVSARAGGSGLGLALARRIVSAHSGTIALVGASTFRIELPST